MLSIFGKEVRKLRIDQNMTLSSMAEKLDVRPTFLTAIETGRKNVPIEFPTKVAKIFGGGVELLKRLEDAAYKSRNAYKVTLNNNTCSRDREVVALFAKEFANLEPEDKEKIGEILEKYEQGVLL